MLRVAGRIRHCCDLTYFDYLTSGRCDAWGRGRYAGQPAAKPSAFGDLRRHFRRYGKPREALHALLGERRFDMALIQLRQITRSHMDTAWTFAAVLGLGIAVLVFEPVVQTAPLSASQSWPLPSM